MIGCHLLLSQEILFQMCQICNYYYAAGGGGGIQSYFFPGSRKKEPQEIPLVIHSLCD